MLVLVSALTLTWTGLRSTAPEALPASAGSISGNEVLSSLPDDAYVIVVDAGHGGFDGGAVGSSTGVVEAELNLSVARLLANELLKRGYYVIMTREDNNALAETKSEDMECRRRIMQLDCVDLVVSVHMNKFTESSVSGPMVFYMKNSAEGKALAEKVMNSLCSNLGRPQRIVNPEELFVLRVPYAPSVLVECGFLSNYNDEQMLCDEVYQAKLAEAICEGIVAYMAAKPQNDAVSPTGKQPLG